jgi:hypothetical protein
MTQFLPTSTNYATDFIFCKIKYIYARPHVRFHKIREMSTMTIINNLKKQILGI